MQSIHTSGNPRLRTHGKSNSRRSKHVNRAVIVALLTTALPAIALGQDELPAPKNSPPIKVIEASPLKMADEEPSPAQEPGGITFPEGMIEDLPKPKEAADSADAKKGEKTQPAVPKYRAMGPKTQPANPSIQIVPPVSPNQQTPNQQTPPQPPVTPAPSPPSMSDTLSPIVQPAAPMQILPPVPSVPPSMQPIPTAPMGQNCPLQDPIFVEQEMQIGVDETLGEEDFDDSEIDDLLDMVEDDVSQLSNVQVTRPSVAPSLDTAVSTVERKASTVGKTPAAVFVITNEMIRRSGARSIPEVLRMAPGVNVARIDGNKWAVSIRGFNSRFANKLLVQIDGRSVYNPLFAGVYWDVQNVVLEDVAQIEVIRGPGGTVWGENAVNGVINIVTKDAKDTVGSFAEVGGGSIEGGFATVREGRKVGRDAHIRSYATWYERNDLVSEFDHDDGRNLQVGSRFDYDLSRSDHLTVQGDYYRGSSGTASQFASPTVPAPITIYDEEVEGANVLLRRSHTNRDETGWSFQAYVEATDRQLVGAGAGYSRQTIDLDFQRRIKPWAFHEVIYGLGYRHNWDDFTNQDFFLSLDPRKDDYNIISGFVQDTMTLVEDSLFLSVGTKVSHNDFSGGEIQPSARLLWSYNDRTSLWSSVSRAVRTPSRLVRDGRVTLQPFQAGPSTIYPVVNPGRDLEAEDILSWEVGMRRQPLDLFSWDAALFYNQYDDLIGIRQIGGVTPGLPEGLIVPNVFANTGTATAYGAELATTFNPSSDWSVRTAYSYLNLDIDGTSLSDEGDSPSHQFYLQSSHQLSRTLELDLIYRFVDALPAQAVSDYNVMDVRLGWHPNEALEVFAVGQNLLDSNRREFGNDSLAGTRSTAIPRGVYGGVAFRY